MANYLNQNDSKALWQKIISEIGQLPSLPAIIILLIKELDNENATPESLEKIIINDATLSAKILRIANSAFYGQSKQIDTISRAIILLGMKTIRNIAMSISSHKTLHNNLHGYGLESGELFLHSLATAVGAGYIAKHTKFQENEKIFIAGLLHDIGKILLSPYLTKCIDLIKNIVEKQNKPFNIAEREVFGFNHCDLGVELANQWDLPQIIGDANKFHHSPTECKNVNQKIIEYIHIADRIAYLSNFGLGIDGHNYHISQEIFDKYNLNEKRIDNFIEVVKKETNEIIKSIT